MQRDVAFFDGDLEGRCLSIEQKAPLNLLRNESFLNLYDDLYSVDC
jgi:hypothetical protein